VCKSYSVRMCSICLFNGRRSNQADVRNTKQPIVNVYKMYL